MIFRHIAVLHKLFEVTATSEINAGHDSSNRFLLAVHACTLTAVLTSGNVQTW